MNYDMIYKSLYFFLLERECVFTLSKQMCELRYHIQPMNSRRPIFIYQIHFCDFADIVIFVMQLKDLHYWFGEAFDLCCLTQTVHRIPKTFGACATDTGSFPQL